MIIKWLNKLGFVGTDAVELAKKKPVQQIFAGEKKMLDILEPLFTSGRELTEAQLANAIYEGMSSIRSDVSKFYKDKYGRSYKNPAGSITDRNQAKSIAKKYKESVKEKVKDYDDKKDALADLEYKAELIASTQAAMATNQERDFILKMMSVKKSWKADLDFRTCKICERLNNNNISANKSFPKPAPIHPRCRCYVAYYDADGKEII
jgi:hypothetical protein